jgi:hypothetical protein
LQRLHRRILLPLLLLLPLVPPAQAAVFTRLDASTSRLVANVLGAPARLRASTLGAGGMSVPAGVALLAVDRDGVEAFRAGPGGSLALPIADGGSLALELTPYDGLTPSNAFSYTDDTGRHAFSPDVTLFRGRIAGEVGSWAVIAMSREGVFGTLQHAGQRWNLGPSQSVASGHAAAGAPLPAHVLSPESVRGNDARPFECGIDERNERAMTLPLALEEPRGSLKAGARAYALGASRTYWKLAVDCDYEVYHNKFADNLTAAASYALAVLGTVNLIYERDLEATLNVTYLNLWTTASDPYSASTTGSQLTQMQGYWATNNGAIQRSAAFLMSGRPLGGGIALIGSLCNTPSAFGLAAMDFTYTYPTATSTWDVDVVAHEIGHIFGSYHTQSCNWALQGYIPASTTLDSCFASEGACAVYTNHLPPGKGTIMSYCHVAFGVANGIRLDFHPVCVQRMRAVMAVSACSTLAIAQPPQNPATAPLAAGVRVSWSASSSAGVLGYEVFRSPKPFDVHPTRVGFTAALQFDDPALGVNYYRMRTVRAADTSSWCAEVQGSSPCGYVNDLPFTIGAAAIGAGSGDFNADGREDFVTLRPVTGELAMLSGQGAGSVGNGTFAPPVTSVTGVTPTCLNAADVTGDGILDLIVGTQADNTLRMHRGQALAGVPTGTFLAPVVLQTLAFAPRAISVADLNEDNLDDLLVCADSTVIRLFGQGTNGTANGAFGPPQSTPLGMVSADLKARDLNADGILDLAITGSTGLRILLGGGVNGHGDGTFSPPSASYPAGTDPGSMAIADLNLDGADDIVVCDRADSVVRVFLGNRTAGIPNGTYAAGTPFACGGAPSAITLVDWDHNGVADVVVGNDTAPGKITLLLGRGDGGLSFPVPLGSGGAGATALLATDFNEDGSLDIVAINHTDGNASRISASCTGALSIAVALSSPNGGETWFEPEERTVSWTRGAGVLSVDVQLSTDSGVHWRTIAREISTLSWKWTVAGPTSTHARLRVVAHGLPQSSDASNADFTLAPAGGLAVGDDTPRLTLLSAWPNPARRELTVSFALPVGGHGVLDLVDLLGRRVALRDLASFGPGTHQVQLLEQQALPPGVYLVRLRVGGDLKLAKVAVVR